MEGVRWGWAGEGTGRREGGRRPSSQKKKGWEHGERGVKGHGCGVYDHYMEGKAKWWVSSEEAKSRE